MKLFFVVALLGCVILSEAHSIKKRGLIDVGECKRRGEACDGIPSCCNELVCYWEGGISPLRDGVCVECIREGNVCQRDSQCCEPLACIKQKIFYVNGECKEKLNTGGHCHNDADCKSNKCEREYMISLHGKCA